MCVCLCVIHVCAYTYVFDGSTLFPLFHAYSPLLCKGTYNASGRLDRHVFRSVLLLLHSRLLDRQCHSEPGHIQQFGQV